MKILYVITKSNFGGAQRYVFDMAKSMKERGNDVAVASGGNGELVNRLREAGIRTIPIAGMGRDMRFFTKDTVAFFSLLQIIRKERPDVLHLNSSKVGGMGAFIGRVLFVRRIIFTAHGWAFEENRSLIERIAIKSLHWLTILFSHATIAVSDTMLAEMRHLPFVKNKTNVVHNGLVPAPILSRAEAREFLRSRNTALNDAFSRGAFVVGTIAELHHIKNLPLAAGAVGDLSAERDAVFVQMGDGDVREMKKMVAAGSPDRVFSLGFVADAPRYLKAFDAFTMSSNYEGLNFATLEAGAAGLPVIATEVGGMREIIENEKTGLLVPPRDRAALTHALQRLASDSTLRERLGSALQEKVTREFSWKQTVVATEAAYR